MLPEAAANKIAGDKSAERSVAPFSLGGGGSKYSKQTSGAEAQVTPSATPELKLQPPKEHHA
jgi:hypothetical protein